MSIIYKFIGITIEVGLHMICYVSSVSQKILPVTKLKSNNNSKKKFT